MKKTYIIFSLLTVLFVGLGFFVIPSEASAYGSYYNYHGSYRYDIPSYSTDYPGYHGYRNSSYVVDNNYITPKSYNSYPNNNYSYNYYYYNAPVYKTDNVVYSPYSNYRVNYNNNNSQNSNYGYGNSESCYGYGC